MGLDDAATDGQAEPAPLVPARSPAHLREFVEDQIHVVLGDPHARIDHGNLEQGRLPDLRLHPLRAEGDEAAGRRELDGVSEKVDQDLLDLFAIEDRGIDAVADPSLHPQTPFLDHRLELAGHVREHLGQPMLPRVDLHAPGIHLRDVEQIVQETREPVAALARLLEKVTLLIVELTDAPAQEHPVVAADDGRGRPQLVGDHVQELGPLLEDGPQFLVGRVEFAVAVVQFGIRPEQLFFQRAAEAHVAHGELQGGELAELDRRGPQLEPDLPAIPPVDPSLQEYDGRAVRPRGGRGARQRLIEERIGRGAHEVPARHPGKGFESQARVDHQTVLDREQPVAEPVE